jgi:hypothetical protein
MTLIGAFGAGALVWVATHVDEDTTYGYWYVYGLIALAGLVMALSQLLGGWTKWGVPRISYSVFLWAFVPVAIAGLWILAFNHPQDTWLREHVRDWSNDLRLGDVAAHFRNERGVAAFVIGLVFGFTFDTAGPIERVRREPPSVPPPGRDRDMVDERPSAEAPPSEPPPREGPPA